MDTGFSGTVLVVDDDDLVRSVTARMVAASGHCVLTARHGVEALAIFEERRHDITCVLLDAVMPVMNGRETFRRIRTIRADVPVIVMSGFGAETVSDVDGPGEPPGFLEKPCGLNDLAAVLREAHASPGADAGQ
jgi:CheY-like chemotaxis protein